MGLIKNKYIKTTWNGANKSHLLDKGYKFTKIGDDIEVLSQDIQPTSPMKVECRCNICNKEFIRQRRQIKDEDYTLCKSCTAKNNHKPKLCSCGKPIERPGKYDKCPACRITQFTCNDYLFVDDKTIKIILRNSNQEVNGFTFIDKDDLDKVIKYKWRISTNNYILGGEDNQTRLHRYIMDCPEDKEVDHINRITIDNRKCNLRVVDRKENCNNRTSYGDLRYYALKYNDVTNGEGVRMSFWTQGCDIRCNGCHNSSIWDFDGGKPYSYHVIEEIKEHMYDNNIKRDFSILGGEPLADRNLNVTLDVVINVKRFFPKAKIWLWTGHLYEELKDFKQIMILQFLDTLVDGRFELDKRDLTLKHKGSANQREIDVQESLKKGKIILIK